MNPKNESPSASMAGTATMTAHGAVIEALVPRFLSHLAELTIQEQCQWLVTWRSLLTTNEAILVEAGVTPREFAALLEIDCSHVPHGPTIGMLAERLRTRHNTSVGLVTRMSNKGYVRRFRDPRDRRQAHVQLTDKGRQVLTTLVRAHCQAFDAIRTELVTGAAA